MATRAPRRLGDYHGQCGGDQGGADGTFEDPGSFEHTEGRREGGAAG